MAHTTSRPRVVQRNAGRLENRRLEASDAIKPDRSSGTLVPEHNADYRTFVQAEELRMGADHPLFRTQHLLETLAAGRLFSETQLSHMEARNPQSSQEARNPQSSQEARDPQFAQANRDPQFAQANRDPQFAQANRDPQVSEENRNHQSVVLDERKPTIAHTSSPHSSSPSPSGRRQERASRPPSPFPEPLEAPVLHSILTTLEGGGPRDSIAQPPLFTAVSKSASSYRRWAAVNTSRLKVRSPTPRGNRRATRFGTTPRVQMTGHKRTLCLTSSGNPRPAGSASVKGLDRGTLRG